MSRGEIAAAVIAFIMAAACAVISVRQFAEKGVPFNNAWLYATPEERQKMDKRPHFRQSAIAFCLASAICVVIGLSIVLQNEKLNLINIPLVAGTLVYVVVSSVKSPDK